LDGPRAPRSDELDSLLDLLSATWPHFARRYTERELRSRIRRPVHRRYARIIVEDGRVVSNIQTIHNRVSIYGSPFKVASIGGVCTREQSRNRGLAGTILQHCLDETTARGARLLYVSGGRGLYRRHHCVDAGPYLHVELTPDSLPPPTSSATPRRVTADDWPTLARLYQAEPSRFVRTADFLARTCFWWDETRPEMWLVESSGAPVAYLITAPPWGADPADPTRILGEYAGSRAAILDSLPAILQATGAARAKLAIPAHDRAFLHLLSSLGASPAPATLFGHTIRLLNLPGLMRDLRSHLAALLPRADLRQLSFDQQGTTCLFACGDQRAEFDLADAARIVFGAPDAPQLPGDLARALSPVFPLPLPAPGLNYI